MSLEHYPPAPAAVPAALTVPAPAYRRNVWLAVLGLLGFVAVYVALTGWFAYKAVTLLQTAWQGGPRAWLAFASGAVAAFITVFLAKAVFFVRHHPDRGLIEISEADEPRLFAFLRRLAAETGAKAPYRVYLSPRVNAAVFYDLSLLNLLLPSRKNLEIGVGLINTLTLTELKAVLAHELGHFAQRSMAVGRWVYIAQQVVGHIVTKRDILDRMLLGLSRIDLRVAWIGWGLRLMVWSIRSVLDSLFAVIVLAERALAREMELQADLVAVSVSGSDALVHALRKLPAADAAWDVALEVFAAELQAGRFTPDLCALQERALARTREVLDDPLHGAAPPLPDVGQADHRVFSAGLCQPPQMWSTHPPSRAREDNAKRRYVAAQLDERPAWLVFADPAALQRKVAEHTATLIGKPAKVETIDVAAALAVVDRRYDKRFLDRRYRGAYLGRSVTRSVERPADLCPPIVPEPAAVQAALRELYPESLSSRVVSAREQASEVAQLEALRLGLAKAPGGVIRYGGREYRRRELDAVIAAAKQDHAASLAALRDHDRASRSAHDAAAALVGRGWPAYLAGLRELLHYAEHVEADVDDAGGHLSNVVAVVTADGKISGGEAKRLIVSGQDLQHLLQSVFEQRHAVVLPPPVAKKLGVTAWHEALPDKLGLTPPDEGNLASFMQFVDDWFTAFSGPLGGLRGATLDELLAAEAHVAQALLTETDPGDAPDVARVPQHYTRLCLGQERERQLRLGWWDRFMVADGLGPGLARLAIAGAVVGVVLSFGGTVGDPTLVLHNGLGRDVVVTVGALEVPLRAHGREELPITAGPNVHIRARTAEGREIEAFAADASDPTVEYLYSVGGASPLVEYVAVYGSNVAPSPKHLGAPRWLATRADDVLREPPATVRSRGTSRRTVIAALTDRPVLELLAPLDPPEAERVALFNARWQPGADKDGRWLQFASNLPGFPEVVQARLDAGESSVMLGRFEQDIRDGAAHDAVCTRHEAAAAAAPTDADAAYLAARCIADEAVRDARFLELHEQYPEHPWLLQAIAYARFEHDEFAAAISALATATREIPALAEDNAVLLARLRRRAGAPEPDLEASSDLSVELRYLRALERGESLGGPLVTAYRSLAAGDVAAAVAEADATDLPRVLRLAAVSEGADPTVVASARALAPDAGIDGSTVWSAYAFAAKHGLDVAPYAAQVQQIAPPFAAALARFVAREQLLADLDDARRALHTLPPQLRGHAAVMGIVTLGADAPPEWRLDARLLFASERPYLSERPPPAPPAPVEAVAPAPKPTRKRK